MGVLAAGEASGHWQPNTAGAQEPDGLYVGVELRGREVAHALGEGLGRDCDGEGEARKESRVGVVWCELPMCRPYIVSRQGQSGVPELWASAKQGDGEPCVWTVQEPSPSIRAPNSY